MPIPGSASARNAVGHRGEGTPMSTSTATFSRHSGPASVGRCDRCFARAKIRVVFPSGHDLLFCGYHARRHENGLSGLAVQMLPLDELDGPST